MVEEFLLKVVFAVIGIAMGVVAGELALKRKTSTTSTLFIAVVTGRIALIITDAILQVLVH